MQGVAAYNQGGALRQKEETTIRGLDAGKENTAGTVDPVYGVSASALEATGTIVPPTLGVGVGLVHKRSSANPRQGPACGAVRGWYGSFPWLEHSVTRVTGPCFAHG